MNSLLTKELLLISGMATLPALLGVVLGERLRSHVNEQRFRKFVFVLVCAIGIKIFVTELPVLINKIGAAQF